MTSILLAWELGAGTGHCVNLKPIAERLIERGHDITFAARDLATAKRVFGPLRVSYFQAPFLVSNVPDSVRRPYSFAEILHNVGFGDDQRLEVLLQAWRNLIATIQPAAIVCEHAPTALMASRWFAVRTFVIGTGFFSPPDVSPWPNVRPNSPPGTVESARTCELQLLARMNGILDGDGLAPLARLSQLYSSVDDTFLTTFRELDHYADRAATPYYGVWQPEGGVMPNWPSTGPRVFAYLQPASGHWPLVPALNSLRNTRCSTVVYVPGLDQRQFASFAHANLTFANGPVDMAAVARNCEFAIHNGNAGTATTLLLAGIPQVIIPLHLEQAVFSQRIVELGAGLALRPDRVERLETAFSILVEHQEFKTSARKFAARYATFDAIKSQMKICDRILKCLSL